MDESFHHFAPVKVMASGLTTLTVIRNCSYEESRALNPPANG
jgi:hypothetical protein